MKIISQTLALLLVCCGFSLPVAAEIYAVHSDHLGTPTKLTDSAKRVVWSATNRGFGEGIYNTDPDADGRKVDMPLRYPGQYFDKESGLHYNYFRYYDPTVGRYITSDPIGLAGGVNTYGYAGGNPLLYVDPWGLAPDSDIKTIDPFVDPLRFIDELGGVGGGGSCRTFPARKSLWSSTKNKSAVENALGHWNKHKSEFPELQNSKQYAERAHDFLANPPSGALTKTNDRGDTLRYDPGTNTFGVLSKDGAPRTMFRPNDGIDYWNRQ